MKKTTPQIPPDRHEVAKPKKLMTPEEAVAAVVDLQRTINTIMNRIPQVRANAEQQCAQLTNEANNLIGRSDQLVEMYGISTKDQIEPLLRKPAAPQPVRSATRQERRRAAREAAAKR